VALYVSPVEPPALPQDDPLDVRDVPRAKGEQLLHNQILGRTGSQGAARLKIMQAGSLHHEHFKRQPTKGNVYRNSFGRVQQQYAVVVGEFSGIRDAAPVRRSENRLDERVLASKAGEQSHIDIPGKSRLSPTQKRDSPYDAKPPLLPNEEILKVESRPQQRYHGRSLANQACCSTRPDVLGAGGPIQAPEEPKS
jgi:hypothetical protein